jgi:hypothetical protein
MLDTQDHHTPTVLKMSRNYSRAMEMENDLEVLGKIGSDA